MGNNHYLSESYMEDYYAMEKEFLEGDPLYDAEKIAFPLSTKNMAIVDATGKRVKLAGVNWSGGHAERHCVGGLDYQKLADICKIIRKDLDLNSVRLCFSLQMYFDNNVIEERHIKANPDLYGKTSREIFDITVQTLTDHGIMIYLNNHTSKSQWCCSGEDGDGLWWNQAYPEEKFEECLLELTKRYKDNPRVIGIDLRNQIRNNGKIHPTWGSQDRETDWHMEAQKIGNKILEIAPHWLIIVGGLNYQLDLTRAKNHPIVLNVPNKLVYTGHLYGFSLPDKIITCEFKKENVALNEKNFMEHYFNQQLYARSQGVPYLLGEFGDNGQSPYWKNLIKCLQTTDLDWTYWCLDGYKCAKQEDESYGVLKKNFKDIRHAWKVNDFKRIGRPVKNTQKRLGMQYMEH